MINRNTLSSAFSNCPEYGGEAEFYRVSETVGLKAYNNKQIRDIAFYTQKKLAKLGLAPKVYRRMHINGRYCLTTQIADTSTWIRGDEQEEFLRKLYRLPFMLPTRIYCDIHGGNLGIIDGNIVLIDCGASESISISKIRNIGYRHNIAKKYDRLKGIPA